MVYDVMETPYFDHLSSVDYEYIYKPAEDTFLLLDALESDLTYIEEHLKPKICLEIGSGSGLISAALAKRLKNTLCLATDINFHACRATRETAIRNQTNVDSMCCNLADNIRPYCIDLLLFNPPYVVTTKEELQKSFHKTEHLNTDLIYSWAGGINGRQIIDSLIKRLPTIISSDGVLYLLLLKENNLEEIMRLLLSVGFKSEQLMERKIPGEHLYVVKAQRI